MDSIKKTFNIVENHYVFDYNDVRMLLTIFNVVMIIIFGLSVAYVGLIIAVFSTIRDFVYEERKINSFLQNIFMIVLNCYFVSLM